MAASMMSASLVQTRVTVRAVAPSRQRTALVVRAEAAQPTSRRAALGLFAGVIGGLSLAAGEAQAKTKVAYQDSIGRGGSSTAASSSGYGMEGTKKRGLSPTGRKEFLAKSKQAALAGLAGKK